MPDPAMAKHYLPGPTRSLMAVESSAYLMNRVKWLSTWIGDERPAPEPPESLSRDIITMLDDIAQNICEHSPTLAQEEALLRAARPS
jgi:hypothetical protein